MLYFFLLEIDQTYSWHILVGVKTSKTFALKNWNTFKWQHQCAVPIIIHIFHSKHYFVLDTGWIKVSVFIMSIENVIVQLKDCEPDSMNFSKERNKPFFSYYRFELSTFRCLYLTFRVSINEAHFQCHQLICWKRFILLLNRIGFRSNWPLLNQFCNSRFRSLNSSTKKIIQKINQNKMK